MLDEGAEFVTTQACQRVAPAHLAGQQGADLAEQVVPGVVAVDVVDGLEPVQVQVQERVLHAGIDVVGGIGHDPRQAPLELAPVDQARQGVVGGRVGELVGRPAPLGHVVEYQHDAGRAPVPVADRGCRIRDRHFRAIAAQQQDAIA